jgi:hypothetical protein
MNAILFVALGMFCILGANVRNVGIITYVAILVGLVGKLHS